MNRIPKSILLVDDDALDLIILEDMLCTLLGADCQIHEAHSATAALELLRAGTPVDLLLMDVCMPDIDGPMFLRQLAEVGFKAKIVLVSSLNTNLMHSIHELGRTHGLSILGYVQKPVASHALKQVLQALSHPPTPKTGGLPAKNEALDLSVNGLRRAIETRQIRPWYQPKIESDKLRMVGVEALARWQLPSGEVVSPGRFIPAIEKLGLTDVLFEHLLDQVLADLAHWRSQGWTIKASVNLAMDTANDLGLPDRIDAQAKRYQVPPEQLIIEVTESQLMTEKSKALETLSRVSLKGYCLSIDDFGTGFSGLSQLAALPFAELKIDGSFVQRATSDQKALAILNSTIIFARSLGMEVVAEGVETSEQLDLIRERGVKELQGFLIAKPMPPQALERWLSEWRPGLMGVNTCTQAFTVLIVDDSRSIRAVTAAEIASRIPHATILQAEHGDEAIAIATSRPVDAATIDFHMPGLNGIEVLRKLRETRPAARFVLLTSDLSESLAKEATALGALYIPKPTGRHQIDRVVNHFLHD